MLTTDSLVALFEDTNDSIASIIFKFLDALGKDMLHLKLSNSQLKRILERVVPLQNFVHVLQCLAKSEDTALQIPTNFELDEAALKRLYFCTLFSRQEQHKNLLGATTIAKFIIRYHDHPFCLQVMTYFPLNLDFLFSTIQAQEYIAGSETLKVVIIWRELLKIIKDSETRFENGFVGFTVSKRWIEESRWRFAISSKKLLSGTDPLLPCSIFFLPPYSVSVDIELLNDIMENRDLILYLLLSGARINTHKEHCTMLIEGILSHPKWQQYKVEQEFQQVLFSLRYFVFYRRFVTP